MTNIQNILSVSLPLKKVEISLSNQPWVFLTLLFLFLLLTLFLNRKNGDFFDGIKRVFQNRNKELEAFGSEKKYSFYYSLLFNFFSLLVFSLYTYVLFNDSLKVLEFRDFVTLCGVMIFFYFLKYLVFKILGYIFSKSELYSYFSTAYFQLLGMLNLVLFPILVLYVYVPTFSQMAFVFVSIFSFFLFFILVTIKLYQSFFVKRIVLFYIFLYLCTAEIMPLFILFRMYSMFL